MATRSGEPLVLSSWKEIAVHMGKGVRTVQRWEQKLGLPVLRPNDPIRKGMVLAYPSALDEWLKSHWSRRGEGAALAGRSVSHPTRKPVSETIQRAHALRDMNALLMREVSRALAVLAERCATLSSAATEPHNNGIHEMPGLDGPRPVTRSTHVA